MRPIAEAPSAGSGRVLHASAGSGSVVDNGSDDGERAPTEVASSPEMVPTEVASSPAFEPAFERLLSGTEPCGFIGCKKIATTCVPHPALPGTTLLACAEHARRQVEFTWPCYLVVVVVL